MIGPTIECDLSDLAELSALYPQESERARLSRVTEAALLLEKLVTEAAPVGAGPIHFRDTIFSKAALRGTSAWGVVSSPAKYAIPIELGTRPHFPPVAAIQHWVERKLGHSGRDATSVAFLIARAISRRGTPAQHPFQKGFDAGRSRAESILARITDDIARAIGA
jgi:hypothetical protein